MKIPLFIINLFLVMPLFSQKTEEDLGSIAVLIQSGSRTGTGFYVSDSINRRVILITACHVLMDKQLHLFSDSIILISYKKNSQSDKKDSLVVSLQSAYNKKMLKFDVEKDVAVLQIATDTNTRIYYEPFVRKVSSTSTRLNTWTLENRKLISDLITTDNIYTVGYPRSLSLLQNFDFDRPLVRRGIIAGIDFTKKKIIADCPVYQGNSGGIVLQFGQDGAGFLAGIIVEFVAFEEYWKNEAYNYSNRTIYNSGYAVVVPVDQLLEQINLLGN